SGVVLSACQLACAIGVLAPFLVLARLPSPDVGLDGWGSLLALGGLGSGLAYALNYAVVRARGSAVASTVTYLIPVLATVLGARVPLRARSCRCRRIPGRRPPTSRHRRSAPCSWPACMTRPLP